MTDLPPSSTHPAQPTGPETIFVDRHRISCDGGGGALGHPLVYYSLEDGEAICGYCGRKFIYDPARVDPVAS
ncbi:MAG: zinc-finger domain-containing protein [Pseudomonadota bacterium]